MLDAGVGCSTTYHGENQTDHSKQCIKSTLVTRRVLLQLLVMLLSIKVLG